MQAKPPVRNTMERSPEKAGVGGSIPSLATMFSTTYQACQDRIRSIPFHKKINKWAREGSANPRMDGKLRAKEHLITVPAAHIEIEFSRELELFREEAEGGAQFFYSYLAVH